MENNNIKNFIKVKLRESVETIKQPKNFLNEIFGRLANDSEMIPLTEMTMDRLLGKHYNNGFSIISASRGDNTAAENNQKTNELFQNIKNTKFTFIPAFGGFIENKGTEEEKHVYEKVFIILNFDKFGNELPFEELQQFALEMCEMFNQDSVLVKAPNGNPKYLSRTGNVDNEFSGDIKINDLTQQYFTSFVKTQKLNKDNQEDRKKNRFTFEAVYLNPSPVTYSERHLRYLSGERFL